MVLGYSGAERAFETNGAGQFLLVKHAMRVYESLKVRKANHDKSCHLVFPTAGCKPKLDSLDNLRP